MRIQSVKTFFLNVIMLIWESNLSRMREVCETHLPTASILITILNFNSKILRMVFESSLQVCTGMIFFTNVPMSGQREHLSSLGGSLCSQGQLLQQLLHCTYTSHYPVSTVPALSTVHTVQCTLSTARFRRSYSKHSTPCSLHWVKTETNQLLLCPADCRLHNFHCCKLCTLSTVVQWTLWLHTNLTESRPLQQLGLKFDLARVLRRTAHCTLIFTLCITHCLFHTTHSKS